MFPPSAVSRRLEPAVICGQEIHGRKHICAFVDSREEQYDILMPFLRQGFEQPDFILSILDPQHADDYRRRCEQAGVDLDAHEASGKAPALRFSNTYLQDGFFSARRMVEMIRKTMEDSRRSGYPRVRGFGEMHWALSGLPGTDELIEYESSVNEVWDEYQDPVLCIYDLKHLSGRVLLDDLATHPKVILDGKVVENQYYIPPKQFLEQYRKRRARASQAALDHFK